MVLHKKPESKLADLGVRQTKESTDKECSIVKAIEGDCPICNKVHLIEQRKRRTQALVKDEVVQYEEIYWYCPLSEEENEFVAAGLMDENLVRARDAYRVKMGL